MQFNTTVYNTVEPNLVLSTSVYESTFFCFFLEHVCFGEK
jgi:hypothetical protein